MTAADVEAFEEQLVSQTGMYLDRIAECVGLLPRLLAQYAAGESYRRTVDRIEDVTDQIVWIAGTESGVRIEPAGGSDR